MNFDFSLSGPVDHPSRLGEVYAPIRMEGPVFWNEALGGWAVTGFHEVKTVLKRNRDFQNGRSPQRSAFGPQAMLFHDTGTHNRLRAVWADAVLPASVKARAERLAELAAHRIGPLIERLRQGEAVDLVPVFQDYTTDVITALMDVADGRRADFQRWNRIISGTAQLALPEGDPRLAERDEAKREVYAFLETEVDRHKARIAAGETLDDLASMMIAAEGQGGITQEQVLDNLLNLFLGALDTTVYWLGNVAFVLLTHREALAEIAANPSLFPDALEEIQRYQSVVQVSTRHLESEDFEIAGQTLRQGDMVFFLPGVASWDPSIFPHPERFDIHRRVEPEKAHLGFGFGMHQCLGMHLARAEVLAFYEPLLALLERCSIAEVEFGPSWTLWGPRRITIRLDKGA